MTEPAPLAGRVIGITADRRHEEQAELFRKRGAEVLHAPTMRTMDLADDAALRAATEALIGEPPDWFLATTGYGVRIWLDAAEAWGLRDQVVDALGGARRVARGAKSRSALRQVGLDEEWTAPGESMPEVVQYAVDQGAEGARVAVQLFDPDEHPTTLDLREVAGSLVELPVYRWLLPDDPSPALGLVDAVVAGGVDAVTFTSQPAVRFLFRLAGDRAGELRDAFNRGDVLPVCIGPVCAEALDEAGVSEPIWPEPFRLVPMVRLAEDRLTSPR